MQKLLWSALTVLALVDAGRADWSWMTYSPHNDASQQAEWDLYRSLKTGEPMTYREVVEASKFSGRASILSQHLDRLTREGYLEYRAGEKTWLGGWTAAGGVRFPSRPLFGGESITDGRSLCLY